MNIVAGPILYLSDKMHSPKIQTVTDKSDLTQKENNPGAAKENASSYCPACSARLESHRCKLCCPVCGYYMSCSDYY
jgi:hypothetical protein